MSQHNPDRATNGVRRRPPAALLLLALTALACSTVTSMLLGTPTPAPTATPPATATASPAPTIAPTLTATPLPITLTPSPYPTLTAAPPGVPTPPAGTQEVGDRRRQLSIFQQLWDTVNTRYVYTDFNGHDWQAIGDKYRAQVEAGLSDDEFYALMDEMIAELGDDHSTFESPEQADESDRALAGDNNYAGIGVLIAPHIEKGYVSVIVTFKNSPAEQAGLRPHDRILAADGLSLLGADGFLHTELLRGDVGQPVTISVQSPGGEPHDVTLVRAQITGAVPIDYWMVPGTRIAYILIPTLFDETIAEQVEAALADLSQDGPLEGVILDNREDDGGATSEGDELLGLFTHGLVGHFRSRTEARPVRIAGRDVAGSQTVPLAVLVGTGTVSYGEISSGILKDQGRATIVGETSLGNVEVLWPFDFEGGSRAWIAVERFDPINSNDDWEQTGIVPDIVAPAEWDEVSGADDPGIQAAVKALQSGQ